MRTLHVARIARTGGVRERFVPLAALRGCGDHTWHVTSTDFRSQRAPRHDACTDASITRRSVRLTSSQGQSDGTQSTLEQSDLTVANLMCVLTNCFCTASGSSPGGEMTSSRCCSAALPCSADLGLSRITTLTRRASLQPRAQMRLPPTAASAPNRPWQDRPGMSTRATARRSPARRFGPARGVFSSKGDSPSFVDQHPARDRLGRDDRPISRAWRTVGSRGRCSSRNPDSGS